MVDCKHPQVGPGNQDMSTAKALRSDHPEVVMFGRRCLGESAGLYVKAKAFEDAGNDQMAIKARRGCKQGGDLAKTAARTS